jgi:hypothetical protein
MVLTLLSMLGGGLMRLLPEVMSFFNKKTDNQHELNMLDRQIELEKTKTAGHIQEISLSGDISETLALLDTQKEALKGQMQITGIRFVDALNFLVRPITTYYLLLLYGIAKVALFILAVHSEMSVELLIGKVYDEEDKAILSGILAFWFVGRSIDKKK